MLKNRQNFDVNSLDCETLISHSENNLISDTSATSTTPVSTASSSAALSTSTSTATRFASSSASNRNGENGVNNNCDHLLGEEEQASSSVVIEYNHVEQLAAEPETAMEDERASSSQDDGMMSLAASSDSGSVISVDNNAGVNEIVPAVAAVAGAEQPEVTDFLDMDFDAEPSSADEEEQCDHAGAEKGNAARGATVNGKRSDGLDTCSNFSAVGSDRRQVHTIEDDSPAYSAPCTSFAEQVSTVPKRGFLAPSATTDSSQCVHGCRACNCDCSYDGSDRIRRPSASGPCDFLTTLGDLLHLRPARPASSRVDTPSLLPGLLDFRLTNRQLFRRYPRHGNQEAVAARARCGLRDANVNVGGPDGLRLAQSAHIRYPTIARPGSGITADSGTRFEKGAGVTYRIWSLEDAERIQTTQIGPSACGATALINVLRALGSKENEFGDISLGDIAKAVPTRLRANEFPVADYLLSRSVAGTDAEDLVEAAGALTGGRVLGRFFPMTDTAIVTGPQEAHFGRWLLDWLKRGAVPVLTLNMQRGLMPWEPIPDAWHHQMVFGVCMKTGGVFVTNPLECMPLWYLKHALCSPSVLLVKDEDVRDRWHGRAADLSPLFAASPTHPRPVAPVLWTEMNVLGQVAQVLRQTSIVNSNAEPVLSHIAIPARYRSGVTLFALADSETWQAILDHPNVEDALALSVAIALSKASCQEEDEQASSVTQIHESGDSPMTGLTEPRQEPPAENELQFSSDSDHYETLLQCEHSQSCRTM